MGIKSIFQAGFRELKRKSTLHKERGGLSEKEKELAGKLTLLGKKAWDSKIGIQSFGNLNEALKLVEEKRKEIGAKVDGLNKEISGLEEKKKAENAKFEALLKDLETKKKPVDAELKSEKDKFGKAWKETDSIQNRLKGIPDDQEKIRKKMAEGQTQPQVVAENEKKLAALKAEQEQLQQKLPDLSKIIQASQEKITPLEGKSGRLEGEIKDVKDQHKRVIDDIDKSLSTAKSAVQEWGQKQKEVSRQQDQNYQALGTKLFEANVADTAVGAELAAAQAVKKDMERIQAGIQSLEGQKTVVPRGAVWKMVGVVLLFLVIIAAIAVGIVFLTKHKAGNKGGSGKPETQLTQIQKDGSPDTTKTQKKEDAGDNRLLVLR